MSNPTTDEVIQKTRDFARQELNNYQTLTQDGIITFTRDQLFAENARLRAALQQIANTKSLARSLSFPDQPDDRMLLAGLTGAIRIANEALSL